MGYFMFYAAVIATCLLWSATFTAAAARTERTWLRRLLVALAVTVPALSLLPFVFCTGLLAFHSPPLQTNWFGPTLTTTIAALIGAIWIAFAGHSRTAFASRRAAEWPVGRLAALFVAANAVSLGIVLAIAHAVAAQAPYLRIEAAALMQANLPPAVVDADNAAALYRQVFSELGADKAIPALFSSGTANPSDPAVANALARHASTLDLLRRAADRKQCRFVRDWTRPSPDLLLPELGPMRNSARLLSLAARREAAGGNAAEALRDVARISRIGRHAACEPIAVSNLVGLAIDRMALETLAGVLPGLTKKDLPLLDEPGFSDLLMTMPSLSKTLYGEEAFGLSIFADLADGTRGFELMPSLEEFRDTLRPPPLEQPLMTLIRGFLLPGDIAGYRSLMRDYQQAAGGLGPSSEVRKWVKDIEERFRQRSPGIYTSSLLPALGGMFRAEAQGEAVHRAAAVLVAATRNRLEAGGLPETLDGLVPSQLPTVPRDPFTDDKPLLVRRTDASWTVYSVGADGEDDGGPPDPGTEKPEGNDDVGLRLAR